MKKNIVLLAVATITLSASSCTPPEYGEMSPTAKTPKLKGNYPSAYPFAKPGYVISPFKPHNVLDVKGMTPGTLAQDPTTAAIDPATKKPISSTAKTFRIPAPAPKPAAPAPQKKKDA